MAIPRFVRPFTQRLFNPLSRRFADRLPWFCVLTVVGRKTGRVYRIPLNVFGRPGGRVFALTYGADVQWVRNVLAAGGAEMVSRGRPIAMTNPRLVVDRRAHLVPVPVRWFLRLIRVDHFLVIDAA